MNEIKKIILILLIFLIEHEVNAQCPPNAHFEGQLEIDSLLIKYPNCDSLFSISINQLIDYSTGVPTIVDTVFNLNGFQNIKYISGDLGSIITGLNWLNDISGLDNVETVDGDMQIRYAGQISNFNGFKSLKNIYGDLKFEITNLDSITGFGVLENLDGTFHISYNERLKYVSPLGPLDKTKSIWVYDNSELVDLDFLKSITNLTGPVRIIENDKIINLQGLNNLREAQAITIRKNTSLLSIAELSSFENLASETSSNIIIDRNPKLTSTIGLENMNMSTISDLVITENPNLQFCNSINICDYLSSPFTNATIIGNGTNCATRQIIVDNCENGFNILSDQLDECLDILEIEISNNMGNHEDLIHIKNSEDEILCSINAMGNNLGNTKFELFVSSETRSQNRPYANRDISISPEIQPNSPVFIRLYYTDQEIEILIDADEDINNINDLSISSSNNNCAGVVIMDTNNFANFSIGELDLEKNIYVDFYTDHFSNFHLHGQGELLLNEKSLSNIDVSLMNNVVSEYLHLRGVDNSFEYSISNLDGHQLIYRKLAENLQIDVSYYESGIYFLTIHNKDGQNVFKFIKM